MWKRKCVCLCVRECLRIFSVTICAGKASGITENYLKPIVAVISDLCLKTTDVHGELLAKLVTAEKRPYVTRGFIRRHEESHEERKEPHRGAEEPNETNTES